MEPITTENVHFGTVVRAGRSIGAVKPGELYVVVGYNKAGPRDTNGFMLHVSPYTFKNNRAHGGSIHLGVATYSIHVPADVFQVVAASIEEAEVVRR